MACHKYEGFGTPRVFMNFLTDNAFLGVAAVGITFVILSGGIDLSVGAVIGCVSIMLAVLVSKHHVHPLLAIAIVLAFGAVLGTVHGCLIHYFSIPPFLATLAGLFFCRGLALLISQESIQIAHPFFQRLSSLSFPADGKVTLSFVALVFLIVLFIGICVSIYTRFGRNVYAVGGSEQSALLMGIPVAVTKVGIYTVSGFCCALAGVVFSIYTTSGNATACVGLELDAIAATVVGGTLLSGGYGYVAGTFLGVLIFGIIQTGISFQGTLSSWWTKIAIGVLLLIFILLQRIIQRKGASA